MTSSRWRDPRLAGQSLKVSYDFANDFTLTSIPSHDEFKLNDRLDVDRTSYAQLNNFQSGRFGADADYSGVPAVISVPTARFAIRSACSMAITILPAASSVDRCSRSPTGTPPAGSTVKAAFGQADWEFLPATTATLGARYQDEKIDYTFDDIQNAASFAGSSTDEASTYRIGVRHEFTDDFMLFISHATGHKVRPTISRRASTRREQRRARSIRRRPSRTRSVSRAACSIGAWC